MNGALASIAIALSLALTSGCSPAGDDAQSAIEQSEQASAPSFVSADFAVPTAIKGEGFKLVPLGPELAEIDYAAYMSSIEHLQTTFTRSTSWPREGLTADDAILDMETEEARFKARTSFAYAVLTPDGTRERGCVYVYPSEVEGYDAKVSLWVTKAEFDAGFDEELYAWTQKWIASEWPFEKVAYPGRAIAWEEWDALVEGAPENGPENGAES